MNFSCFTMIVTATGSCTEVAPFAAVIAAQVENW